MTNFNHLICPKLLKTLLQIVAIVVYTQSVYAYRITGRIVDDRLNKPLHGAVFLARNENNRVVIGIQADQAGRFTSCDVSDSILNVMVYHNENYDTLRMTLRGVPEGITDIGDLQLKRAAVQLKEVTVTASANPVQAPDKYVVYPSQSDLVRNASSINLLEHLQYSLPGLKVIESLNQVSVNGLAPEYMINGRKVSLSRILGLNNSNILRIEYYDNPQMRFGDRPAINFILKPRADGGSFVANINSAVTTDNIGGNVGITYYKGKSEWNLNYDISHRDYNDRRVSQTENFIGGNYMNFTRQSEGLPGQFAYTNNNLVLDYTFKPGEKTLLSLDISGNLYKQNLNDLTQLTQVYNSVTASSQTDTRRSARLKSPAYDIYFQQKIHDNQSIEVNAFGVYYDGQFTRNYVNGLEGIAINTNTDNESWRVGGEAKYSIRFNRHTAYFGVSDSYNRALTDLVENDLPESSRIGINNIFAYGQLSGRLFEKLAYNGSVGIKSYQSSNGIEQKNAARAKGSFYLTYNVTNPLSLSYMLLYEPSMPGTESQSSIVQSVNDYLLRTGNVNIKPSTLFKNQVKAQYYGKSFVSLLTVGYSRTFNPIYYDYTYIADPASQNNNKFLGKSENGKYNSAFCIEGEYVYRNLFNHLNLGVDAGWCDYTLKRQNWNDSYSFGFGSIYASLTFSDFTLTTQYTLYPFYSLSGNTFSRPERWNSIAAQYKYRNWYFRATVVNPFTKRGSLYHTWANTPAYTTEDWVDIRNCANMLLLSATYRFNFGKFMNKANRTIKNSGVDTGVDMNF
jgi:hypothetical protein